MNNEKLIKHLESEIERCKTEREKHSTYGSPLNQTKEYQYWSGCIHALEATLNEIEILKREEREKFTQIKNEYVEVTICYGYGIRFVVSVLAEIGCPEEKIKHAAIEWFKQYMPIPQQVEQVESLIEQKKAWIEIEHEFK